MRKAGVVLAGGQSKRMGCDKSQLTINGQTLLVHAQEILKSTGIKNIFISGHEGISDKYPNKGPLGGILTSLLSLQQFDCVTFIPVDMPFLTKNMLLNLIQEQLPAAYFEGYNLPLMITNNAVIRQKIAEQINNNDLSLYKMLIQLEAKPLKHALAKDVFINTNSPIEWQEAIRKLRG